jgi:hypothetical protein
MVNGKMITFPLTQPTNEPNAQTKDGCPQWCDGHGLFRAALIAACATLSRCNEYGQLGNGSAPASAVPVAVSGGGPGRPSAPYCSQLWPEDRQRPVLLG